MASNWGYSKTNGPNTWANLFPLSAGKRQSPIDIQKQCVKLENCGTSKLIWKYPIESRRQIANNGCCWQVMIDDKHSELSGGPLEDKYILHQFHCHWGADNQEGSEHTLDGKKFAGELHLVHWNAEKYESFSEATTHNDGLCVLGVFLLAGNTTHKEIQKIVTSLNAIQYKGLTAEINALVDPGQLLPSNSGYYTYEGSLTTPPCLECVRWILFKEPIIVSDDQLAAFRKLHSYCPDDCQLDDEFQGKILMNFRPTLPIGDRVIKEFLS